MADQGEDVSHRNPTDHSAGGWVWRFFQVLAVLCGVLGIGLAALLHKVPLDLWTLNLWFLGFGFGLALAFAIMARQVHSTSTRLWTSFGAALVVVIPIASISTGLVSAPRQSASLAVSPTGTASITQPHRDDEVSTPMNVYGSSKNLTDGENIWVFVVKEETPATLYPMPAPALVDPKGDWFSYGVTIGDPQGDRGKPFQVLAILTTDAGAKQIAQCWTTARQAGAACSIDQLPSGTVESDHVRVKRI